MTSRPHSLAALYFGSQGAAGLAWWLSLLAVPSLRAPFVAAGAPEATLFALAPADILLFAGGSLAASAGISRGARWAMPLAWLTAGACAYAALYTVGLAWLAGASWLGAALMLPAAAASVAAAARAPNRTPA